MKIASWNVNSINVRLSQVLAWLEESRAEVLALQETKVVDALFPIAAFEAAGYSVCFSGQKTYNGVAVISRSPLGHPILDNPHFVDPERRFLAVTVNGIRIVNLYVPNGQSLDSPKYQYKLTWLAAVKSFLEEELRQYPEMVVLGDFNIAPMDLDVHDPASWAGSVLVSDLEREAFSALLSVGFVDALRAHFPDSALYTWWDYRQAAFRRNLGLRIDHILLSNALIEKLESGGVDQLPRKHERPSDHAPVWVTLSVPPLDVTTTG